MSASIDSQDLRGYLGGLCLIVVVRAVGRTPTKVDIEDILRRRLGQEIDTFVMSLASFTGIEPASLHLATETLFEADEDWLRPENINLQLGLLAKRPMPVFPFVTADRADERALYRPLLDTATNLLHAAVRVRMQVAPSSPGGAHAFWGDLVGFLRRACGDDAVASAIALTTVVNVASDILFFNSEAAERTEDPALATNIARVLEELRTIPIAVLASR